jgi:hypothetical protein
MNINIEPFYCHIKKEHLFAYESNFEEHELVCVFAVRSVANRALLFHCMTESGMQRANIPISALVHKTDAPKIDLDYLQLLAMRLMFANSIILLIGDVKLR